MSLIQERITPEMKVEHAVILHTLCIVLQNTSYTFVQITSLTSSSSSDQFLCPSLCQAGTPESTSTEEVRQSDVHDGIVLF